jgi:hypothetical protein
MEWKTCWICQGSTINSDNDCGSQDEQHQKARSGER